MVNALSLLPCKTASCPTMGDYAIKNKVNVSWANRKKGDVVLFDFNNNGTSDHIGIVVSVNSDGSITTVEGNTGSGSNTNGGQVQKRTRYKKEVNYFVRPKYNKDITADMVIATALAEVGVKESPKNSNKVKYNQWFYGKNESAFWCCTFVCWVFAHVQLPPKPVPKPTGKYSGTIPSPTLKRGSKGTNVKNLQKFLNWYCPTWELSVDGEFGERTQTALKIFQTTEKISADGVYGNQSCTKAKAYYVAPPKPTTPTTPTLKKPTGKYSGTIPSPTLKKGSKGTSVKNLQKFLNWYGGFKLSVDGGFGDKTLSALKTFQKTEGLTADGIYGKASQAKAKTYKAATTKTTTTTSTATGANAKKLIAQMDKLAWKYGTAKSKYAYKTGAPTSACKTAMKKYKYNTKAKYSDCGNFVNTVVREAGIDKSFTSLHGVKKAFPKSESKFNIVHSGKAIPSGLLKAGDIIRYKKTGNDQHAMFYYGNGKVCDAGHYNRFGNIRADEKRYGFSNVKKSTIQVLRVKE